MRDFEEYQAISRQLRQSEIVKAREALIQLLDRRAKDGLAQNEILNHLLREVGLYQYMDLSTSNWMDSFAANLFSSSIGPQENRVLHLEQAHILKRLIQGESLAISAPTSFGKSYIIDAYIAMRQPDCVVIIVPTVALANETRRRLAKKFSSLYKVITTTGENLSDKNLFVFPQERAFSYIDLIQKIDLLIVDEFYKVAALHDDRADRLQAAIVELSKKAKQRYFLGPNIDSIEDNPITAGMSFLKIDFQTVISHIDHAYKEREPHEDAKAFKFNKIEALLSDSRTKTLIYAGSHNAIKDVKDGLIPRLQLTTQPLCILFKEWLQANYGTDCDLLPLVERGIGIHNGNLHRSLAQLQIKLFEEVDGLNTMLSTSSIIEGVNTQAERVILWNCKLSNQALDYFTFRNIVGRAGRMFKYFIGYVTLLEAPPQKAEQQLEIHISEDVVHGLDEQNPGIALNAKQRKSISNYNAELQNVVGKSVFNSLKNEPSIKGASPRLVLLLAKKIKADANWPRNYVCLSRNDTFHWREALEDVLIVAFPNDAYKLLLTAIGAFSYNWRKTIPWILNKYGKYHLDASNFFKYERDVNFKVPMIFSIVNLLKQAIWPGSPDITSFIQRASNVFLPRNVYELEEYGLPRMISKKICRSGIIDLEDDNKPLSNVVEEFKAVGFERISRIAGMSEMDQYILQYFYEGI